MDINPIAYVRHQPNNKRSILYKNNVEVIIELAPITAKSLPDFSVWNDVVPPSVAKNQKLWERRQIMFRLRHMGYTLKEIAQYMGVSLPIVERAYELITVQIQRGTNVSPVEKWFKEEKWLNELRGQFIHVCHFTNACGNLYAQSNLRIDLVRNYQNFLWLTIAKRLVY